MSHRIFEFDRKPNRKYGALTHFALNFDGPIEKFNEVLDDVEAQTRTWMIPGCGAVDLAKFVKN